MTARPETATAQLKIRVREDVRRQLEASARENDWPLNKEIAERLEKTLREDENLGGGRTAAFLRLTATLVDAIEQETGQDWLSDPMTFATVRRVIRALVDRRRPTGPDEDALLETIVERMLLIRGDEATDSGQDDARVIAIADGELEKYNEQLFLGTVDRDE